MPWKLVCRGCGLWGTATWRGTEWRLIFTQRYKAQHVQTIADACSGPFRLEPRERDVAQDSGREAGSSRRGPCTATVSSGEAICVEESHGPEPVRHEARMTKLLGLSAPVALSLALNACNRWILT